MLCIFGIVYVTRKQCTFTYISLMSATVALMLKYTFRKYIGCPRKIQLFGERSELCETQETRGSKFICEFGRNSTVYCFVASGLLNSFEIHL